jgi:cytoskeletal protein RodZ
MTAPAKSRRRTAPATRGRSEAARTPATAEPDQTLDPGQAAPRRASRGRTSAAERAYARRAQRADLLKDREPRPAPKAEPGEPKQKVKLKLRLVPKSRASFVLMMMALLAVGVAATLWLTTQAIADSYRLEQLRTTNAHLAETKEQLQRDVAKAESPASLAPAAQQLGMVPGGDPARIVVGPDGKTSLVGEPKKAKADTPPVETAPPVAAAAGTQSQQGAPIEGDQPAVPAEEQPPAQPGGGQ